MMREDEILQVVYTITLVLLFISLFITIYQFFYLLKQHEVLKKAWEKSIKVLDTKRKNRKELEKSNAALYGEMESKTFISRLDAALSYSGIYARFPTWSVEYIVAVLVVGLLLELFLVWLATKNVLLAIVVTMLTAFTLYQMLQTVRLIRRKLIDTELLKMLDLMEKAVITSNEIVSVLGKIVIRLKGPLKKEVFRTIVEAESTGDKSYAFRHMMNRVENKHVKDLFLNLGVASKHSSNYSAVITRIKKVYITDKDNREQVQKMYRNSFINILVMVVIIFWIVSMSVENVTDLMRTEGLIGQCIFLYIIILSVATLWTTGIKVFL